MNRYIPLGITLALALGACAQYDTAASVVKDRGAEAADRLLEASEFGTCEAATLGSAQRRYGRTTEGARVHREFCGYAHSLIGPR